MARKRELPLNLTSIDDLFTTQEERDERAKDKIEEIPLSEIDGFPEHPYHVRDDEDMQHLVESVREIGIITPAKLRRKDDGRYELVSGHRRKHAARLAGLETIPSVVKDMTHDEAIIEMVDANLQRERILPSEKAFAYKMKIDAIKRQGKRSDLTSVPSAQKLTSREIVAMQAGESQDQVRRYVRLTELVPELLGLVDEGKMGMRPAVELSYLSTDEQLALYDAMEQESCTPSHAQAIKLRKFSQERGLSFDACLCVMREEKPNQAEQLRIPNEAISRFFKPNATREEKAQRIVKALELLEKQERKRSLER